MALAQGRAKTWGWSGPTHMKLLGWIPPQPILGLSLAIFFMKCLALNRDPMNARCHRPVHTVCGLTCVSPTSVYTMSLQDISWYPIKGCLTHHPRSMLTIRLDLETDMTIVPVDNALLRLRFILTLHLKLSSPCSSYSPIDVNGGLPFVV